MRTPASPKRQRSACPIRIGAKSSGLTWCVDRAVELDAETDVLAHCRANLARYKVPAVVEFVDSLPRTTVGKVDKKALRAGQVTAGQL